MPRYYFWLAVCCVLTVKCLVFENASIPIAATNFTTISPARLSTIVGSPSNRVESLSVELREVVAALVPSLLPAFRVVLSHILFFGIPPLPLPESHCFVGGTTNPKKMHWNSDSPGKGAAAALPDNLGLRRIQEGRTPTWTCCSAICCFSHFSHSHLAKQICWGDWPVWAVVVVDTFVHLGKLLDAETFVYCRVLVLDTHLKQERNFENKWNQECSTAASGTKSYAFCWIKVLS